MERIRGTLPKDLNDAIRKYGLIGANPATYVELPHTDRPKARVWTESRVRTWRETGRIDSPVMVWTPAQAGQFTLDEATAADLAAYAAHRAAFQHAEGHRTTSNTGATWVGNGHRKPKVRRRTPSPPT